MEIWRQSILSRVNFKYKGPEAGPKGGPFKHWKEDLAGWGWAENENRQGPEHTGPC